MIEVNPKLRISASEAVQNDWILEHTAINPLEINDLTLLTNLRCFHSNRKMQCAVLAFISSQLQVKDERKELIEIFTSIDVDALSFKRKNYKNDLENFKKFLTDSSMLEKEIYDEILKLVN